MPPKRRTPKTTKNAASRRPTSGGAPSRKTLAVALGGAVLIVVVLIAGSIAFGRGDGGGDSTSGSATVDTSLLEGLQQDGTTLGSPEARVTLIQWEDFQCPACRAYQENAFPGLVREYVRTGKVKVQFMGLAFIGEDSEQALRAALAAAAQGKFWHMEKALYDNQGEENEGWVTDDLIRDLAAKIGLDVAKLEADMGSGTVSDQIEQMRNEGRRQQIPGTPTFFVSVDGGTPYHVQPDAFTPDVFRPILDDALQR